MDDDLFPIKTVADYLRAGDKAVEVMLRLPNMGVKSVNELDNLIQGVLDARGLDKSSMFDTDKCRDIHTDAALLGISEIVELNVTSERLRNSIRFAVNNGGLPFETIGDYIRAGSEAIRVMKNLPNLGKKTAIELDDLIKGILANTNTDVRVGDDSAGMLHVEVNKSGMDIPDVVEILLQKFQKDLKEREYSVLKYRAIEERTLEEIGEIYDVTRERIRQIEKKAKSKLIKMYRVAFNRIASKLDEILDESYGEVGLLDAASALNLTPDILKLLVYICAEQCVNPVRVWHDYLLRSSIESSHSEWNEAINEVLYSLRWPVLMSDVYDGLQDIPQSYVERYLEKNRGAIIENGAVVELRNIPQTARMIYVLREAGRPLHSSEIIRIYHSMFGEEIKEHNAQSIIGRMEEALIVDRGVYSLYETLNISENKITEIRRHSYEYIQKKEEYVSSKVLYEELFKNNVDFQKLDNPYIVHGVLQDDARFLIRRGLMVGIREHVGFVEFKPLTNEVHELVDENGPLSVSKIKAVLSDRRKILSVTINMILDGSDEIVKVAPGMYNTIINVFGTRALYEHLKIAIRIALSDHDQGLFELTTNLRSLEVFNDIDVTKSMIMSVANMMKDISNKERHYSVCLSNKNIETYNTIKINAYAQGKSKIIFEKEVEKLLGEELARNYIAADYRMQSTEHEISGKKDITGSNSEIDSILSAFEI
ncbi:MAG: sigma factor-like helix-turn-helix DNA-binding protein [Nitrosomonadaceae bacterium]